MDTERMSSYDLHILLDVPVLPAEAAHGRVAERPSLFVFNTNPSWIHRDGHWVAATLTNVAVDFSLIRLDATQGGLDSIDSWQTTARRGFSTTDNCNL